MFAALLILRLQSLTLTLTGESVLLHLFLLGFCGDDAMRPVNIIIALIPHPSHHKHIPNIAGRRVCWPSYYESAAAALARAPGLGLGGAEIRF